MTKPIASVFLLLFLTLSPTAAIGGNTFQKLLVSDLDDDSLISDLGEKNFFFLDIDGTLVSNEYALVNSGVLRDSLDFYREHLMLQTVFFPLKQMGDQNRVILFLRPGAIPFIKTLSNIKGSRIIFYSHGTRDRNGALLGKLVSDFDLPKDYSVYSREDEPGERIDGKSIKAILEMELRKLTQSNKVSQKLLQYYLSRSVLIDDLVHFQSESSIFQVYQFKVADCHSDFFSWESCNQLFILMGLIHEALEALGESQINSLPNSLSRQIRAQETIANFRGNLFDVAKKGLKIMKEVDPKLELFELTSH